MEGLKELYEQERYMELQKTCQEAIDAGKEDAGIFGYCACAQAARNNLSRPSLKEGIENLKKAFSCGKEYGEEGYLKELYKEFTAQVKKAMASSETMIAGLSLSAEIMVSYRECLALGIQALLDAAELAGEDGEEAVTLDNKKMALHYMREYCLTRQYDVDMGKNVLHKTDNIADKAREKYVAAYDRIVEEIRQKEPGFEPEEDIQREKKLPYQEEREKREKEEAEGKKRGILEKFMDLF